MTNDLEQRVNEVLKHQNKITKGVIDIVEHEDVEGSDPIGLKISPSGKYTPATEYDYEAWKDLEKILQIVQDQQTEIQRLKDQRLKLRPKESV